MRTAAVRPTAPAPAPAPAPAASSEPAASAGGGYAVQVSSQRSEAEAQSAYRALAAKYPDQLGGHAPIVRRADLGSKGIYYRALVGPFASMEQAAGICSSLKAAGGSCIVQKN
jgi:cell division septation protein DedD